MLLEGRCGLFSWVFIIFIPWTYGYMGATMGVKEPSCDDAKTNLVVDWDYSFTAYTCMGFSKWKSNQVWHYCMNTSILYKDRPPIRGHHRPLWAKYGEYLYVPPQRWLHNLEHGSVVMLYHPCADEDQVHKLRKLVTSCLWRHVITPYDKLSNDRPLALVAWGAKLEMNTVDVIQSVLFMRKHAHVAPEDLSKEGQYDELLLTASSIVSDKDDTTVCPWVPTTRARVDDSHEGYLNRNMLFGASNNDLLRKMSKLAPNGRLLNKSPSDKRRWKDNNELENGLRRDRRTFIDVMNLAEKYNGPNFVSDVLPPHAAQQLYQQPNYVAAGTYLGNDPFHPVSQVHGPAPPPTNPDGTPVGPAPSTGQQPTNSNLFQNGANVPFGMPTGDRFTAPGSGNNPAEVLAAMAMLMRKDGSSGDMANAFPPQQGQMQQNAALFDPSASNNLRFPQQQQFLQQQQPNFGQAGGQDQFSTWQNTNNGAWAGTTTSGYQQSNGAYGAMAPSYGNDQQQGYSSGAADATNDIILQGLLSSMSARNGNQQAPGDMNFAGSQQAVPNLNGQRMNNDQSLMYLSALGGGGGRGAYRYVLKASKRSKLLLPFLLRSSA